MHALGGPARTGRPMIVAAASLPAIALFAVSLASGARELEVYENDAQLSRPGGFRATIRTPGQDDICDFRAARPSEHACAGIDVADRQKHMTDTVQGSPGFEWLAHADVATESGPVTIQVLRFSADTRRKIDRTVIERAIGELTEGLKQAFVDAAPVGPPTITETPNPAGTIDMEGGSGETATFIRAHVVVGEGAGYALVFAGPRAARETTIGIADATIATIQVEAPTPRDPAARWYFYLLIAGPAALIAWVRRGRTPKEAPTAPPGAPPEDPRAREARRNRRRARRAEQASESEETNDGA